MSATLITGGLVLAENGPTIADVLVVDGVIADVDHDLMATRAEVLDASGCWVGPGFVDLHTHLREPGGEHKEDIASGTAAAAAGGYTAVVAMPNTEPAVDAGHLARFVAERGAAAGYVDVMPAGCLSAGRQGTALAHLDELWEAGVRLFTDDGDSVEDAGLLRRAMEYLEQLGGVVVQHAMDRGLAAGGHMHEGTVSSRLGMQGVPALAEEIVVARDLALVRLTGARYHIQHVSTAGTVALVAEAKAAGLPVTAEVTPHHLAFCHDDVATTDPVFKMMPPLRTAEDRRVLRAALDEGVIDVVATDHAPHAAHEKDVPFEEAPNGVIGLEWAAAVVSSVCNLDAETFFTRMSITPAAIAGLADHGRRIGPGSVANLVVFDPAREWVATTTLSRSVNAPYLGRPWRGSVVATMLRGRVTSAPVGIRR